MPMTQERKVDLSRLSDDELLARARALGSRIEDHLAQCEKVGSQIRHVGSQIRSAIAACDTVLAETAEYG